MKNKSLTIFVLLIISLNFAINTQNYGNKHNTHSLDKIKAIDLLHKNKFEKIFAEKNRLFKMKNEAKGF